MVEVKGWFAEAAEKSLVHNCIDHEFIIYKGFKITRFLEDDRHTIQDVRVNDFYTEVKDSDLTQFHKKGFLAGADYVMYRRDVKRVSSYLNKIKASMLKRNSLRSGAAKNRDKLIANCNRVIHNYNDLMHFYKSRSEYYEKVNKNK